MTADCPGDGAGKRNHEILASMRKMWTYVRIFRYKQCDYVSGHFNASSTGPKGTGGTFARMPLNANSMFRL